MQQGDRLLFKRERRSGDGKHYSNTPLIHSSNYFAFNFSHFSSLRTLVTIGRPRRGKIFVLVMWTLEAGKMEKKRDKMVLRGHRLSRWVQVANSSAVGRETLENLRGELPDFVFERRRNAPTWGLTPRMPVCIVAAWPRPTPPATRRT